VKNPWGSAQASIIGSQGGQAVSASGDPMLFSAQAGHAYLIKKASDTTPSPVQVTGTAATAVKKLGSRIIGI